MNTMKLTPRMILFFAFSLVVINVNAQTAQQDVNVTIRPSQTTEERVAEEVKLKELRKAAEEKLAAEEAARIAATSPKSLLSHARIVWVSSSTDFFEPIHEVSIGKPMKSVPSNSKLLVTSRDREHTRNARQIMMERRVKANDLKPVRYGLRLVL